MTLQQTPPVIAHQNSSTVPPVQSPSSTNYSNPMTGNLTPVRSDQESSWFNELVKSAGGIGAIIIAIMTAGYYLLSEINDIKIEMAKITEKLESANSDISDMKKRHEELQQKFQDLNVNQAVLKERLDIKLSKPN